MGKISYIMNMLTVFVMAVLSVFTGEIVTFVMLAMILLSLTNIYTVLKHIAKKLDQLPHHPPDVPSKSSEENHKGLS